VSGRLHDSRHTLITELCESGAGDQTIMDITGHVSRQMLKHYNHIRMESKRVALEAIAKKQQDAEENMKAEAAKSAQDCSQKRVDDQKGEEEPLQNSLQSNAAGGPRHRKAARKPKKRMAPRVGFEPTTLRLTAECSTVELPRSSNFITPSAPLPCQFLARPHSPVSILRFSSSRFTKMLWFDSMS